MAYVEKESSDGNTLKHYLDIWIYVCKRSIGFYTKVPGTYVGVQHSLIVAAIAY